MYFPYFRGRQYELIALRELLDNPNYSQNIIPIIEPVKASPTLFNTIEAYIKKNRKLIIIVNPQVGSFDLERRNKKEFSEKYDQLINSENIQICFLLKDKNQVQNIFTEKKYNKENAFALFFNHDSSILFEEIKKIYNVNYLFVSESSVVRRNSVANRILLRDRFNKCERNSDYGKNIDEFFSEDHLYYYEDGFYGFGDYSTIGDEYVESGFVPYAVAIHMVYFDKDKSLRIHHFVSDDNNSREDTPGKFGQAIKKLCNFDVLKQYKTSAYKELISFMEAGKYPGLGTVKRISIMHHMELISLFLDGKI